MHFQGHDPVHVLKKSYYKQNYVFITEYVYNPLLYLKSFLVSQAALMALDSIMDKMC